MTIFLSILLWILGSIALGLFTGAFIAAGDRG